MSRSPIHPARVVVPLLQLAAAIPAAWKSFEFGLQISGVPLAVLLAANGAFFGSIMVGFLADLIRRSPGGLEVTTTGRLFIRNIAMRFDPYLPKETERRFSRTV